MLKYFRCPDGEKIEVSKCLETQGCRLGKRCMPRSILMTIGKVRKWEGKPSVTQLICGTYESFLKIIKDYTEDPDEQMFKILGTFGHAKLDENSIKTALMEERLESDDGIGGTFDLYDTENGWCTLVDYKVCGSYKVSKALGIYENLAESKNETYKKKTMISINGQKQEKLPGDVKLVKEYKVNLLNQDCRDWILQLNKYRMMIEELGFKVDELMIGAVVRDGGTIVAKNRGVMKKFYSIPIPILSDNEVNKFFLKKKNDLLKALELGDWNEKCTEEETWSGSKCEKFCEVKEFCKFYGGKKWMQS